MIRSLELDHKIRRNIGIEGPSPNSEFTDIALCHGNCEGACNFSANCSAEQSWQRREFDSRYATTGF